MAEAEALLQEELERAGDSDEAVVKMMTKAR